MTNFNFGLGDLMSNDTSGTNSNPYYREIMSGTSSPFTTSQAYNYQQNGPDSWGNYNSNSILDVSTVMQNTPLSNNPSDVLNNQQQLLSTLTGAGLEQTKGNIGVFGSLIPSDVTYATGVQIGQNPSLISNSSNGSTNNGAAPNGAANSIKNQANGLPAMVSGTEGTVPNGMKAIPTTGSIAVGDFVNTAAQLIGRPYVWGGVGANGGGSDCSGLVYYAMHQLGNSAWPHYSGSQYQYCQSAGTTCSVDEAFNVYGTLVFAPAGNDPAGEHVAISMGDGGHILEAQQTGTTIGVHDASSYKSWFDVAAFVPNVNYSQIVYGKGLGNGTA